MPSTMKFPFPNLTEPLNSFHFVRLFPFCLSSYYYVQYYRLIMIIVCIFCIQDLHMSVLKCTNSGHFTDQPRHLCLIFKHQFHFFPLSITTCRAVIFRVQMKTLNFFYCPTSFLPFSFKFQTFGLVFLEVSHRFRCESLRTTFLPASECKTFVTKNTVYPK